MISVNEAIFSAQGADNKKENVHRDLWVQRKEKLILFHKLKEGFHIESHSVWSFFDWMNNYQRAEGSWEHCADGNDILKPMWEAKCGGNLRSPGATPEGLWVAGHPGVVWFSQRKKGENRTWKKGR